MPIVNPIVNSFSNSAKNSSGLIPPWGAPAFSPGINNSVSIIASPIFTMLEAARPPRKALSESVIAILTNARPNTTRNASTSEPYPRLSMTPFSVPNRPMPARSVHVLDALENHACKTQRLCKHPGTQHCQGQKDGDQLRDIAQRLLLNLRSGLKHADYKAHQYACQHGRRGYH